MDAIGTGDRFRHFSTITRHDVAINVAILLIYSFSFDESRHGALTYIEKHGITYYSSTL